MIWKAGGSLVFLGWALRIWSCMRFFGASSGLQHDAIKLGHVSLISYCHSLHAIAPPSRDELPCAGNSQHVRITSQRSGDVSGLALVVRFTEE
ncbi:hypothetical protein AOLI_G00100130 [Acnodon oligacanthus]